MLMAFRDKATGWLGWVVLALIVVAFSLFGLDYYIQESSRVYAAKVNDVEIPITVFQRDYQVRRQNARRELGDKYDPDTFNDNALRTQVLRSLVNGEVLFQAADRSGFAVSDALLAAQVQSTSVFQVDGEFSTERYRMVLGSQYMDPARYESQVRKDILKNQLTSGVSNTATVPTSMLDRLLEIQGQTRTAEYFIVNRADFEADIEVSDEDISAYYEEHRGEYVDPEQVRLQYVELDAQRYMSEIEIDEAVILQLYKERVQMLRTDEQRKARHILIASAEESEQADAKAKAEAALARVQAGEDFAVVAKELSDDPGSSQMGGDLGFFGRGLMVPEFDDAVFAMEVGQLSELVKTDFGYHIIQLSEINAPDIPSFEDLRDELVAEANEDQLIDRFLDDVEILSNVTFESPDTLDGVVDALELELRNTDWITREGATEGVAANKKVMTAAFAEDVLLRGNNSEVVELPENRAVVVRITGHRESQPRKLETVSADIKQRLIWLRSTESAKEKSKALADRMRDGAPMDVLAAEMNAEVVSREAVSRDSADMDRGILRKIFQLPRPADTPSVGYVRTLIGDFAIIRLTEVIKPDLTTYVADQRETIRRNLAQILGQVGRTSLLAALRRSSEIDTSDVNEL